MKIKLFFGSILLMASTLARAEAGFFAGVTYVFGDRDGIGFTVKALASRRDDRPTAAIGVNIFPSASGTRYGIDLGVGYQGNDAAALVGYDLLLNQFTASLGYADLRDD